MGRHTLPSNRLGRHRLGRGDRTWCRDLPATRDYFAMRSPSPGWLRMFRGDRGRHSFAWFAEHGQAARPAFLLIMML